MKNICIKIKVQNFEDKIISDNSTEYKRDQWHLFASYENVMLGQRWEFSLTGNNIDKNEIFNSRVIYIIRTE